MRSHWGGGGAATWRVTAPATLFLGVWRFPVTSVHSGRSGYRYADDLDVVEEVSA